MNDGSYKMNEGFLRGKKLNECSFEEVLRSFVFMKKYRSSVQLLEWWSEADKYYGEKWQKELSST